ncbi:restriction endonuclease subunit S [Staphylococcus aureus]|uniref:restriction endonuclease subunit S n=2 Tax=Staphylococcus aureus TaxID=1280 RepID=UPI0018D62138|nr:restriction endonuclease subunit S [Staphylococcus aureus]MBH4583499.1 restriction endonuclease subunit S [Staphylococcus aureus]MBH4585821.1 restriction endonuclease subunit S [Staphylococcus aureus]MBH4588423.1 restriction endonuclease subunit S [Staphylococcus aureus]MBH4591383.1 restriction endonuclease subunit S [Staphylococcus aureus]
MSNTQTKNVPELRFPGFEGEYSLDIFGNLATNKSDKFNPQNENASIDIELDCIEQNTGRLIKIYNSKEFSSQKNKFNPQNVLYGKLRPYLNKYYFTKKSGVCSSEIWVLKSTKEDKLLNLFLYYFIQTKRYSEVATKSAGSKMPRADWGLIENIRVYFPELCEQQKIGEFFSKLDRQIELEEQKLELLQQQKKGYMQKIFSQELRFKDENGNDYPDWEEKMIKDVYEITRGLVLSKKLISKKTNDVNKYPVYSSQTTNNGLMGYYSNYLYKDSITWTTDGANAGSVSYRSGKFYCTNVCGVLINEKGNSNLCMSEMLNRIAFKHVSKVGNPKLMNNVMAMVKLNFPCIEEQLKIARFIEAVEKNIINQERKIDLLKQVKNGLLQKMFI